MYLVVKQMFFYNLLVYIILVLFFSTVFLYMLYIYNQKQQNITNDDYTYNVIKLFLLLGLGLSFLLFIVYIYYFYQMYITLINYHMFTAYCVVPYVFTNPLLYWFEFFIDFFGIVLLFLGYFVGILSILALDNRIFWKNIKFIFSLNTFILVVYFYVFSTNLLLFFLFYELLLIPSFLLVYYISPSRRAIQASLYFLI